LQVGDLNPAWNEKDVSEDVRFEEAMKMVGRLFTQKVLYMHNSWMPCRTKVMAAIVERFSVNYVLEEG
jgi:hypothetical protein